MAGHDIVWVRTVAPPEAKMRTYWRWLCERKESYLHSIRILVSLLGVQDCQYRQALYYFGYRCRHQPRSALFLPLGSANVLIGLGTLR